MGCDIHAHVEVRIDDEWHHYNALSIDRNYALFAVIAGVRGEEEALFEPRGLPEKLSVVTQVDVRRCGIDGHTHSWLNPDELDDVVNKMKELAVKEGWKLDCFWQSRNFGYLFGNDLQDFMKYPEDYPKAVQGARLVFWFDC